MAKLYPLVFVYIVYADGRTVVLPSALRFLQWKFPAPYIGIISSSGDNTIMQHTSISLKLFHNLSISNADQISFSFN